MLFHRKSKYFQTLKYFNVHLINFLMRPTTGMLRQNAQEFLGINKEIRFTVHLY